MKLKLASLAVIAALGFGAVDLSGCSNAVKDWEVITGAAVGPQAAIIAANSYDSLVVIATGYLQLPACVVNGPVVCRNAAAVTPIVQAVRSGRAARSQIEGLLAANNGAAIPIASINTLSAAVATLQNIYTQYKVPTTTK